jgi:hypothetical protein
MVTDPTRSISYNVEGVSLLSETPSTLWHHAELHSETPHHMILDTRL